MAIDRRVRLASTRMVQLVGNVLKPVFQIHRFLRPRKRYRIPELGLPFVLARSPRRIPRIVWQTNSTREVTLPIYVNYLFNRLIAPTHEFQFWNDGECEAFVRDYYPELIETYLSLTIGAAKADLWRILVLRTCGGIYLDIDAAFSWPPEYLLDADQSELFIRAKDGKLTNYFLAAEPAHPTLAEVTGKIVDNIRANTLASVYDMTGPTVIDLVARRSRLRIEPSSLVCRQGQFTKKTFQYPEDLRGYWACEEQMRPIVRKKVAPPENGRVKRPNRVR